MFTDDEKDYIMRMIKEIARVLASVMLGKKYVQVELPHTLCPSARGMRNFSRPCCIYLPV